MKRAVAALPLTFAGPGLAGSRVKLMWSHVHYSNAGLRTILVAEGEHNGASTNNGWLLLEQDAASHSRPVPLWRCGASAVEQPRYMKHLDA